MGNGDAVRETYIDPAELADGDFRWRGWLTKLCIELGRDMNSSRSEFGVWLPNDLRLGSLRWRETDVEYDGDSSVGNCMDVEDRREFTLLDRREDMDARLERCDALLRPPTLLPRPAERPLMVPTLCLVDTGLDALLLCEFV